MSFVTQEDGRVLWDVNSELSDEEREQVNKSGLTVPQLRDFWKRFPENNLETAITGCRMEIDAVKKGLKPMLSSEDQDAVSDEFARSENAVGEDSTQETV